MAKAISGFFVVIAVAVALMTVGLKGLETVKAPEASEASAPSRDDDVLSAADALEWQQEFLWHRAIPRVCPNPWIDDQLCAYIPRRL